MKDIKREEHIIENPLVAAISNEIPVVRAVANYWRESIRQTRESRLYEFLNDVANSINVIQQNLNIEVDMKELDQEHLGSKDYLNTVEQCAGLAIGSNDETKIEYLKKFIVNYSLTSRPDISAKDIYLKILQDISGTQLLILDHLFNSQRGLSNRELEDLSNHPHRDEIVNLIELSEAINCDKGLTNLLCTSMGNMGLINVVDESSTNPYYIIKPVSIQIIRFLDEH